MLSTARTYVQSLLRILLLGAGFIASGSPGFLFAESADGMQAAGECVPRDLSRTVWWIQPGLADPASIRERSTNGETRHLIRSFPIFPNNLFPPGDRGSEPREFTLYTIIRSHSGLLNCRDPVLLFPSIGESFRIFWNGDLLMDTSAGPRDGSRAYAYQRDLLVSLHGPIRPGANVLLIHIAGQAPGSLLTPNIYFGLGRNGGYILGDGRELRGHTGRHALYMMIGIYAFAGLIGLWLFGRLPSEPIHAFFAGLCLSLCGYFLAFSPLAFKFLEDTSYLVKAAYACQPPALLFTGLFLHGFIFPDEKRPRLLTIFIFVNLIPTLLVLVTPVQYSQTWLRIWYPLAAIQFVWMGLLLFRGLRRGNINAPAMTVSIAAAALCAIWDVLDSLFFSTGLRLLHLGFLIFLLCMVALLITRFLKLHGDTLRLNEQLDGKVQELGKAHNRLEYLAHHDPLTSLPNRIRFMQGLNARINGSGESTNFAVFFLDLDRFKNVNDAFGHGFGDALLRAVSHRILGALEPEDYAARFGGDAFSIYMASVDTRNIRERAQRILDILRLPYIIDGTEVTCSASIGIVLGATHYGDAEDMLRDADAAMYRAKRRRSEYRIFEEPMREAVQSSLTMETELRRAIQERRIQVHYQPIVSMRTGEMVGAEALVRWEHETLGPVSPLTLIPFAEDTGLIVPLGEMVLVDACKRAREWDEHGRRGLSVSVNVSTVQIHRAGFTPMLERVLRETGLAPNRLVLELTESLLMESDERVLETIKRARKMGIRIAVDDFGTGYSSLSYLHELPLDILKVDRSFTRNLPGSRESAAITRAIIALAHNLGLAVTAEGIENEEQLEFLRGEDCGTGQGWLFSRPLPGDELARWKSPAGNFNKN